MTAEPAGQPIDQFGARLVPDVNLPGWLRPLVAAIDGMVLPPRLRRPGALAPSGARHSAVLMLMADGPQGPDLLLDCHQRALRTTG